jgi:hypothetical protein
METTERDQMKTLGQIAYEATAGAGRFEWQDLVKHDREVWEAAAQAVRDAAIEECAKVCDRLVDLYAGGKHLTDDLEVAASAIRELK